MNFTKPIALQNSKKSRLFQFRKNRQHEFCRALNRQNANFIEPGSANFAKIDKRLILSCLALQNLEKSKILRLSRFCKNRQDIKLRDQAIQHFEKW